ncbi:MAG: glycerophosphodiester phosphodiesterase [Ardenticatenaceae bacterium]|nr:glycerophosphodiester phosphodiesterase [Ardenticatenaceae bacterium]MCB9443842.1 glycerophosphodiester phosphodiesterase [Ardenticatenaceae bacterium]
MKQKRPLHPFASENDVIVLAHRGFRGQYPENTMLAFQKAAELGVDGLETDIHATSDGALVVSHDATVDRMTDGSGPIKEMTLAELQQLDAGYCWTADCGQTFPFRGQGITIPTLEEVFTAFPQFWINVDIKQSEPAIVTPFVAMIRQFEMAERMMVGSFDTETVGRFRQECPEVATAASEPEVRRLFILSKLWLARFYRGKGKALQIPEWNGRLRLITPRFVRDAHRSGTAVHVWTVNETADMQRLIEWGVDGLISDYPDRLLELLGRLA